jgi:uncharacterized protein (DUF2141 family)
MRWFCRGVFVLFLVSVAFAQPQPSQNTPQGSLKVAIAGFKDSQGHLRIALCNSAENYTAIDDGTQMPFRQAEVEVVNPETQHVFEDLPFGFYAIKTSQDKNDNDKLDKSFIGKPTEPYGFSNNARGKRGPPSFEQTKFNFDTDGTVVTIQLR